MHKKRLLLLFLSIALLLSCSQPAYAAKRKKAKKAKEVADYGYMITSDDVNITVSKKNVYHVTERIDVKIGDKFTQMNCRIQKKNVLTWEDKTTYSQTVEVDNVKCKEGDIKLSEEKDAYILSLSEKQDHYTISYDYKVKNHSEENYDAFFYPLIQNQWDAKSLEDYTVHAILPDVVERSKVSLLGKSQGNEVYNAMKLSIKGNVVYIYMENKVVIAGDEQILLAVKYPDGYFQSTWIEQLFAYISWGVLVVAILLAFIAFLYWKKIKSLKHIQSPMVNEAPEGFQCAESAYIYQGKIHRTQVAALVLELARKGYLEIKEDNRYGREAEFALVKKKEYDGIDQEEEFFFNELFKKKEYVKNDDVFNSFYQTTEKVAEMVQGDYEEKIFEQDNRKIRRICVSLSMILGCINMIAGVFLIYNGKINVLHSIIMIVQVLLYIAFIKFFAKSVSQLFLKTNSKKFHNKTCIAFGICTLVLFLLSFHLKGIHCIVNMYMILIQGIVLYFSEHSMKRSKYGENMYACLEGYRIYLDSIQKQEVEALLEDEQKERLSYILPYVYVFQLDEKWEKEFGELTLDLPVWFKKISGDTQETLDEFLKFLGIMITQMCDSIGE